jgi:uncharacterized cupredoxin-like copper-binding protein
LGLRPAKQPRTTNSALEGTFAVGALTLVLVVVLASCGGGGGTGGSSAGKESHSTDKATTSGESTTSASSGGGGKYGSSSSAATTTTKGASGGLLKTIVIEESEFNLSPSSVTLSKPGTYAFKAVNKGSTEHNLRIAGEGVKSEGGQAGEAELERNLDPGESGVLRVTFRKPGTYEMYCPIIGHRLAGMKGEVVVK